MRPLLISIVNSITSEVSTQSEDNEVFFAPLSLPTPLTTAEAGFLAAPIILDDLKEAASLNVPYRSVDSIRTRTLL